ncbi:unnamed protein product [marine sediment metagenome]|uniref:Uncharacterized protein n=1 Tax=marine sediment metagenome TaxID=412755 RepID=X1PZH6_9ZZZZ
MISREWVKDYFAYGLLFILAVAWLCLALVPILMFGEVRWREPCLALLLFEICLLMGIALFALERIINLLYRTIKGDEWKHP